MNTSTPALWRKHWPDVGLTDVETKLHPTPQRYCEAHTRPDSQDLKNLVAATHEQQEKPEIMAGPIVAGLLQLLVRLTQARNILEIGCFTGYTALSMAEAMSDGKITTLEINSDNVTQAKANFEKSKAGHRIEVIEGDAKTLIPALDETFDMVFIDANKASYWAYIEAVTPKLRQGGVIVIDNTLLRHKVLDPKTPSQQQMADFNAILAKDPRFEVVMLPLRDGLTLVYKR